MEKRKGRHGGVCGGGVKGRIFVFLFLSIFLCSVGKKIKSKRKRKRCERYR
jgi:hypothetical protein